MYLSINWLNKFLTLKETSIENFESQITLSGLEIEEIKKEDLITPIKIDFSITANRPDIFSYFGIGQEISIFSNLNWKTYWYLNNSTIANRSIKRDSSKINFIRPSTEIGCNSYFAQTLKNIKVIESPPWVKNQLLLNSILPSDNVLDFFNFIMLEYGKAFHIHDEKKLKKEKNKKDSLCLRYAKDMEVFEGGENGFYHLTKENLVSTYNDSVISILGLIESDTTKVDDFTTDLFVECFSFESTKIRRSSKTLGIRNIRTNFFEKGSNWEFNFSSKKIFRRLVKLLDSHNTLERSAELCHLTEFWSIEQDNRNLSLNLNKLDNILGPVSTNEKNNYQEKYITVFKVINYLESLKFSVYYKNNKLLKIKVPINRYFDIEEEIDVIEEIARIHGYNNFKSILPKTQNIGRISSFESIKTNLRLSFISIGLNELVTFSLDNQAMGLLPSKLKIINPITNDLSYLRVSLIPGLIKLFTKNFNESNDLLSGFEIGRVFTISKKNNILEQEFISGIINSTKVFSINSKKDSTSVTWLQVKGLLEESFKKLNLRVEWVKPATQKNNSNNNKKDFRSLFHINKSASLILENEVIGTFGQINPLVSRMYAIPEDIFLFEINIYALKKYYSLKKFKKYKIYSLYPPLTSYLSLLVPKNISYKDIISVIDTNKNIIVKLFDFYESESLSNNYYSLVLQLIFQSKEKTLSKSDIIESTNQIKKRLEKELSITLRN